MSDTHPPTSSSGRAGRPSTGSGGPKPAEARQRYDRMASDYDQHLGLQSGRLGRYLEAIRKRAVIALRLEQGQTVVDVGCGTGASFGRLVAAVGPGGRVIGVDHSPGMLEIAARRIADAQWANVELVEAPVDKAPLPEADAAIFFLTHDLLRTPAALDNVVTAVRPGGSVVASGMQRPPLWMAPIAVTAELVMRRYVTTRDGLATPWDLLADRLDGVTSESSVLGCLYVVAGHRPRTPEDRTPSRGP